MTVAHCARRSAWIAILAMAGLAFGPTVSRALAAGATSSAPAAHAHCEGMADASDSLGAPADGAAHHGDPLESCELCVVAALPALQPSLSSLLSGDLVAHSRPTLSAPRPIALRPTWSPASSRGPPAPV